MIQRLLLVCAFASGACALIYEVAWLRVLSIDFGITVYAVSCVLCAFMGGLAIGSWCFGRIVDHVRNPLRLYGVIELTLAGMAVAFVVLEPTWHSLSARALQSLPNLPVLAGCVRLLLAFILLLPPTILMGGTLPVLAKMVPDEPVERGRRLGRLYGINTLGAVVGCLLVAYVLILELGTDGSILFAAAINALVGMVCIALAMFRQPDVGTGPIRQVQESRSHASRRVSQGVLLAAFCSGFTTLATEVLWTRLFINFLTSNVLVISTILAAFLCGIALGSLVVARRLDGLSRAMRACFATFLGSSVSSDSLNRQSEPPSVAQLNKWLGFAFLAGAVVLAGSVIGQSLLGELFAAIHQVNRGGSEAAIAVECLVVLFAVVVLPATVLGIVLPIVLRLGGWSQQSLGQDVGRLLAWNTFGAVIGSFIAGYLLIDLLGVNCSLLLLAAGYAGLANVMHPSLRFRVLAVAAMSGVLVMAALPMWRRPVFWFNGGFTGVRQISNDETVFLAEGAEATVGVAQSGEVMSLSVNGIVVAESSLHDLWDLLLKAHLPMLLHEEPKHVALVGLGAGISLGAVEAYDVQQIDCIELSADVVAAHEFFAVFNGRCWKDDRLRLTIGDGRHHLSTSPQRYDIINVDPTDPPVCNQYTREFFQLCHSRLKPGGLMVQWVPLFHLRPLHLRVILQAFHQVFPHTTLWYDGTSLLLIGCRGRPLKTDLARFSKRWRRPAVLDNLTRIARPNPLVLLSTYVAGPQALEKIIGSDVPDNTDARPYLEYRLLLAGPVPPSSIADNLELLIPEFEPVDVWDHVGELSEADQNRLIALRSLMLDLLKVRLLRLRERHREAHTELQQVRRTHELSEVDLKFFEPFLQQ